jgi:hypothetical protein
MDIECHISKNSADYYIEAYTEDIIKDETKKTRLAYIAGYRDYDRFDPTENALLWLELLDKIKEVYSSYPDGEVHVKLVIEEDYVNI